MGNSQPSQPSLPPQNGTEIVDSRVKRIVDALYSMKITTVQNNLYNIVPQDVISERNPLLEILINSVIFLASIFADYKTYLFFFRGGRKLIYDLYYAPSKIVALHNLQVFIKSLYIEGIKSPQTIQNILLAMGLPTWMQNLITIQFIDARIAPLLYMKTGTEEHGKLDLDRTMDALDEAIDAWGNSGMLLDYSDS